MNEYRNILPKHIHIDGDLNYSIKLMNKFNEKIFSLSTFIYYPEDLKNLENLSKIAKQLTIYSEKHLKSAIIPDIFNLLN